MSWFRGDDRLAMSVKVRGLVDPGATGQRAIAQRAEALGAWTMILSWVAGERSDGFVTTDIVDLFATKAAKGRLLRARFERAPLLHARTDPDALDCHCMTARTWPVDYDYALHDYLDRNPSRAENDVHRAKKRELKDAKLKLAVRQRDRDLCRYCGKACKHSDRKSDDGLTFDHVDPEIANGMANLVVACRGCNNRKNRRTPEQAGMALLPMPRPAPPVGSASTSASGSGSDTDPDPDPDLDPDPDPDAGRAPPDPAQTGDQDLTSARISAQNTDATRGASSPGTGRDGTGSAAPGRSPPRPDQIGPPPARPPTGPGSPYLRPQRPLPEHQAGNPPQREDS